MKNHILTILLISSLALCISCNDENEYLNRPITGKLSFIDTISGSTEILPYAKADVEIYMSDNTDDNNYDSYLIPPVKTDKDGKFSFAYAPEKALRFYCKTVINNIDYSGFVKVEKDDTLTNLEIILYPTKGKGLRVFLKDKDGNAIPNQSVDVYASAVDLNNISLAQKVTNVITNNLGIAFFDSLGGGINYYLYSQTTLNGNLYKVIDNITLESNYSGVKDKELKIVPNGLRITLKDDLGNALPNTTVCIFNNVFYSNATSCTNSLSSKVSDNQGVVFFPNLKRGDTYYFLINGTINGTNYTRNDMVTLSSVNEIQEKLSTVPVTYNSNLIIKATDRFGSQVNGLHVCLYVNRSYFELFPLSNYVRQDTTKASGIVEFTGLEAGKYYIRVRDSINPSLIFTKKDSILYDPALPPFTFPLHVDQ